MRIILSTIERTVADKPVRVARAIEPAGKLAGLPPFRLCTVGRGWYYTDVHARPSYLSGSFVSQHNYSMEICVFDSLVRHVPLVVPKPFDSRTKLQNSVVPFDPNFGYRLAGYETMSVFGPADRCCR